jgi:hypothetical protein
MFAVVVKDTACELCSGGQYRENWRILVGRCLRKQDRKEAIRAKNPT